MPLMTFPVMALLYRLKNELTAFFQTIPFHFGLIRTN